jgi:hypothetical protein
MIICNLYKELYKHKEKTNLYQYNLLIIIYLLFKNTTYLTTHTGTTLFIEPLIILTEYIPEDRVDTLSGN